MPRTCSVCNHSQREEIEKALLSGESFRNIAKRTGTSPTALFRHKSDHLAASLVQSKEAADIASADSVLRSVRDQIDQIRRLDDAAEEVLLQAKRSLDLRTALSAIRELANLHREKRATFELVARITGELEQAKREQNWGGMVLIVPPRLPSNAPAQLDRDHWSERGYDGPATQPLLTDGGQIIEGEFEDLPREAGDAE